ncbi:MAG TPA: HypC/HybG/HupF family hydrogenase formation chaperone [Actinomycetota bacterium]|nr:HypC/HybG/HupF family hydrogenase formation chaperone [Actinomycetota bacterium]
MKKGEPLQILDRGSYSVACSVVDGCLTCGDVAVEVTVLEVDGFDAVCEDSHGQAGRVGIDLVLPVEVGDRLLVHAGVAINRLKES